MVLTEIIKLIIDNIMVNAASQILDTNNTHQAKGMLFKSGLNKLLLAVLVSIYSFVFIYAYKNIYSGYISEYYSFALGFVVNNVFYVLPLIISPLIFWRLEEKRVYNFVTLVLYVVMYIPGCLTLTMLPVDSAPFLSLLQYCISCCVSICLLCLFGGYIVKLPYKITLLGRKFANLVLLLLLAFCLIVVFWHFHGVMTFVSIANIYIQRAIYEANSTYFMQLLVTTLSVAFIPIIVAYGCLRKNNYLVVFGFVVTFFLYSITAMKGIFLEPFLILAIYFCARRFSFYQIFVLAMTGFIVLLILPGLISFNYLMSLIYRALYIPGSVALLMYIKYSLYHAPFYWSGLGFVRYFNGDSGQLNSIPFLVSAFSVGRANDMNAGMFIAGLINFGCILGPFIVYVILQCYLFCVNSLEKSYVHTGEAFFISVFSMMYLGLSSSQITTFLVSGGGIILLLVLSLFLRAKRLAF